MVKNSVATNLGRPSGSCVSRERLGVAASPPAQPPVSRVERAVQMFARKSEAHRRVLAGALHEAAATMNAASVRRRPDGRVGGRIGPHEGFDDRRDQ